MRKFIKNLQEKPEPVRRQILFISTFAITGLVLVFWISSLDNEFAGTKKRKPSNENLKPLSLLKDDFVKTFSTVSTGISGIKKDIKDGLDKDGQTSASSTENIQE